MARIRTIKPEFWDDLKLAKISRDARLLYIGTWNFADDIGVIIADHLWLKSKVFPFDQIQIQQFDKWMQELVKSGFISLFSHNGEEFYYLPNLTRHQVINKPNYDKLNVPKSALDGALSGIHGTLPEQSRNDTGMLPSGEERNRKGIVKEIYPPNPPSGGGVCVEVQNREIETIPPHGTKARGAARFVPPTLAEVTTYCAERGSVVDSQQWLDYYTANGWRVGKNAMKDWRAAVRTWEKNRYSKNPASIGRVSHPAANYDNNKTFEKF